MVSKKELKRGFTLIEMLVVIGIIAILSGSLLAGFNAVTKSAQRARAQEAVSNAATALTLYYQKHQEWDPAISAAPAGEGGGQQMDVNVAKLLGKEGLLNVNYRNDQLHGTDRLGILDPWGVAVLKRNKDAGLGTPVPSGGTVQSHLLYFAVDLDGDGIVEANLSDGMRKIRATAVVWCAGRDGKLAPYSQVGRSDDVFSWQRGQEKK